MQVAGVPIIVVPSTRDPAVPTRSFTLTFVGDLYSEALLLALAADYEAASRLRLVSPTL